MIQLLFYVSRNSCGTVLVFDAKRVLVLSEGHATHFIAWKILNIPYEEGHLARCIIYTSTSFLPMLCSSFSVLRN